MFPKRKEENVGVGLEMEGQREGKREGNRGIYREIQRNIEIEQKCNS